MDALCQGGVCGNWVHWVLYAATFASQGCLANGTPHIRFIDVTVSDVWPWS